MHRVRRPVGPRASVVAAALMSAGVLTSRPSARRTTRLLTRDARLPTIRFWLLCGAVLVITSTLLSALVSVWGRAAVLEVQSDLQHRLRPAQEAVSDLARAYVDQETGQRGYIWTGQESFLEPFDTGRQAAESRAAVLAGYLGSDAEARRRLDAVVAAGRAWQQQSALPDITARRQGTFDAADGLRRAAEGKVLFDQLRQRLGDLRQRVDQLVEEQLTAMRTQERRVDLVSALAALVAVGAAVATVVAVHRLTTRPLSLLVTELTQVADGATDQRITVQGPAELRSISRAAETMRTGLVRDAAALAEAQRDLGAFGERERMAVRLQDRTIQRIFRLSLSLSHLIGTRPELAPQAAPLVAETDAIAQELRSIIHPVPAEQESATASAST